MDSVLGVSLGQGTNPTRSRDQDNPEDNQEDDNKEEEKECPVLHSEEVQRKALLLIKHHDRTGSQPADNPLTERGLVEGEGCMRRRR